MLVLMLIGVFLWFCFCIKRILKFLHILQLEGYKTQKLLKWSLSNFPTRIIDILVVKKITALFFLSLLFFFVRTEWMNLIFSIAVSICIFLLLIKKDKIVVKKPLRLTPRATRLLSLSIILIGISFIITFYFIKENFIWLIAIYFIGQLTILFVSLANILLFPIEKTINFIFFNLAKKKIKKYQLNVIGITGSYGKTTTKEILSFLLASKFKVLKTPESYNTPMGISKIIRENLKKDDQIFVAEMGARRKKEIKELCELILPKIGILTAIGIQHLETFKNIDQIIKTKYELIESLPKNGLAILNNDNEYCKELTKKIKIKTIKYGILNKDADIIANNINYGTYGSKFMVCYQNENIQFQTKLLGKHNILNILAATACALQFGITLHEISILIKDLKPVPHRLELLQGKATIIDDAYNSNPEGAKLALEVLSKFNSGNKILVTPGLIELGKEEYNQNKIFGQEAAKVCDFVFLVGRKKTEPIFEGLKQENFPINKIKIAENLTDATYELNKILKFGDTVLFENDLPDNYDEKI